MPEIEWSKDRWSEYGYYGNLGRLWQLIWGSDRNKDEPWLLRCDLLGIERDTHHETVEAAKGHAEKQLGQFRALLAPASHDTYVLDPLLDRRTRLDVIAAECERYGLPEDASALLRHIYRNDAFVFGIKDAHIALLEEKLAKADEALRYITSPTMGLNGQDPEEFAMEGATEANARSALATCIRIAKQAMKGKSDG